MQFYLSKHLTHLIDLAMNDLWYKDGVCFVWKVHCAFVHKEVRCTKKTEIKDGLQYTNKKLSLQGYNNMLYTWGFNNELEKVHFLNHSVFLKLCLLEDCLSLLYGRSM